MTASEQDGLTTAGILAAREAGASARLDGGTFSVGAPVPDVNTPYTPTTDEVETHFHEWAAYLEKTEPGTYPFRTWQEAMYGFRRWLAAHDAAHDVELSRLRGVVEEVRAMVEVEHVKHRTYMEDMELRPPTPRCICGRWLGGESRNKKCPDILALDRFLAALSGGEANHG